MKKPSKKLLKEIINRKPSKWGNLTIKEFYRDMDILQRQADRACKLEKICEQLIGEEWMSDEGLYESEMMKIDRRNKYYQDLLNRLCDTDDIIEVYEIADEYKSLNGQGCEKYE